MCPWQLLLSRRMCKCPQGRRRGCCCRLGSRRVASESKSPPPPPSLGALGTSSGLDDVELTKQKERATTYGDDDDDYDDDLQWNVQLAAAAAEATGSDEQPRAFHRPVTCCWLVSTTHFTAPGPTRAASQCDALVSSWARPSDDANDADENQTETDCSALSL